MYITLYDVLSALWLYAIVVVPIALIYLLGWLAHRLMHTKVRQLHVEDDPRNPGGGNYGVAYMLKDYRRGTVKRGR